VVLPPCGQGSLAGIRRNYRSATVL
jgi:hypothetical protein